VRFFAHTVGAFDKFHPLSPKVCRSNRECVEFHDTLSSSRLFQKAQPFLKQRPLSWFPQQQHQQRQRL
ncbi:hypothetical protein D018_3708B, partial [Vibrio parahaemolyticus VP2007-007]